MHHCSGANIFYNYQSATVHSKNPLAYEHHLMGDKVNFSNVGLLKMHNRSRADILIGFHSTTHPSILSSQTFSMKAPNVTCIKPKIEPKTKVQTIRGSTPWLVSHKSSAGRYTCLFVKDGLRIWLSEPVGSKLIRMSLAGVGIDTNLYRIRYP